ncbi:MAG: polyprenyl synthetase family protein [bacterium]
MNNKLKKYLNNNRKIIEREIKKHISGSASLSRVLKTAVTYSVFSRGKRLRPILVLSASRACDGNIYNALPVAATLELIHTYSLIHDDLPAMDDDDLRRGRPACHKKFGEAMAILAGDALLTKSFEILAKNGKLFRLKTRYYQDLIRVISTAAGMEGMVGGQAEDILSENNAGTHNLGLVLKIHSGKTAALLSACTEAGALCAGADTKKRTKLSRYGFLLGLGFQVMDDVLDRIGDKSELGKKGSDLDNNKLTFPSVIGIDKSVQFAKKKISEAIAELQTFGAQADPLRWIAEYVITRNK